MRKLLILGGTTEASALAQALAGEPEFDTLLSFAGTTRAPRPPPVRHRIGGFGGAEGLAAFLRAGRFDLVIDATHPFAATMKRNAVRATDAVGIPLLGVLRPEWSPVAGDDWIVVAGMAAAARALGDVPRRVLLTIGQKDLAVFRNAAGHSFILRSVDPPDPDVLPIAEVISARGPFLLADEITLLRQRRIEILVTKNSGGAATAAKLEAARACGVRVVMVERPAPPEGVVTVPDAAAAMQWLRAHEAAERGV